MRLFTEKNTPFLLFFITVFLRLVFLAALVLSFGYEGAHSVFIPGSDSIFYVRLADNLRTYGVYSDSPGPPFLPAQLVEPGYPVFLAAIFSIEENILAVLVVQIALAGFSTVLIYAIAHRYFSRSISIAAALLFAIDPVGWFLATSVFTETLFVFFFLLGIYYFLRERLFRAGLCIGIGALIRPELQFFPLIFLFFFIVWRWHNGWRVLAKSSVLFLVGFSLVITPWLLRNYVTFGHIETSAMSMHKFYEFDLVHFYAYQEHISRDEARRMLNAALARRSPHGYYSGFENFPYMRDLAREYISAHPVSFLRYYMASTLPFFFSDGLRYVGSKVALVDVPRVNISEHIVQGEFLALLRELRGGQGIALIFFVAGAVFWGLISVFVLISVGAASWQKRNLLPVLLFFSLVLVFALMSSSVANPRLRYKATPLLFILASVGFHSVLQFSHTRFNRARALENVLNSEKGEEGAKSDEQV